MDPPVTGWLKANTYVAFFNGAARLGVVVRNELGEVVLIMSKFVECCSA